MRSLWKILGGIALVVILAVAGLLAWLAVEEAGDAAAVGRKDRGHARAAGARALHGRERDALPRLPLGRVLRPVRASDSGPAPRDRAVSRSTRSSDVPGRRPGPEHHAGSDERNRGLDRRRGHARDSGGREPGRRGDVSDDAVPELSRALGRGHEGDRGLSAHARADRPCSRAAQARLPGEPHREVHVRSRWTARSRSPTGATRSRTGKYLSTVAGCIFCHTPVDDEAPARSSVRRARAAGS